MRVWLILALGLLLSACSSSNIPFLYKPDIQQGNEINQANAVQLKVGMSKEDVVYLIGEPVLVNILNDSQSNYIYTFKPGKGKMTEQKLVLSFDNNKLVKIN